MDHITPLCAGGADTVENLQWLTKESHKEKTRGDVRQCRLLKPH
ncbi:MAG: HNH endonuclease signature motif containing protein [Rhodoferax sp.]|nr:HNH endonuclease signature motif containing protein [Rhodoferax sp.]MDZ7892361.1 HNH endonuclease signature motif containing protein [Rhodoferax sp.]